LASTTVEQLKSKLAQITELDEAPLLKQFKKKKEICDADAYQSDVEQQIVLLMEFVKKAS